MAVRTGYVWYCKYSVRTKYIEPAVSDWIYRYKKSTIYGCWK